VAALVDVALGFWPASSLCIFTDMQVNTLWAAGMLNVSAIAVKSWASGIAYIRWVQVKKLLGGGRGLHRFNMNTQEAIMAHLATGKTQAPPAWE
jgi:hypothetical protein